MTDHFKELHELVTDQNQKPERFELTPDEYYGHNHTLAAALEAISAQLDYLIQIKEADDER